MLCPYVATNSYASCVIKQFYDTVLKFVDLSGYLTPNVSFWPPIPLHWRRDVRSSSRGTHQTSQTVGPGPNNLVSVWIQCGIESEETREVILHQVEVNHPFVLRWISENSQNPAIWPGRALRKFWAKSVGAFVMKNSWTAGESRSRNALRSGILIALIRLVRPLLQSTAQQCCLSPLLLPSFCLIIPID